MLRTLLAILFTCHVAISEHCVADEVPTHLSVDLYLSANTLLPGEPLFAELAIANRGALIDQVIVSRWTLQMTRMDDTNGGFKQIKRVGGLIEDGIGIYRLQPNERKLVGNQVVWVEPGIDEAWVPVILDAGPYELRAALVTGQDGQVLYSAPKRLVVQNVDVAATRAALGELQRAELIDFIQFDGDYGLKGIECAVELLANPHLIEYRDTLNWFIARGLLLRCEPSWAASISQRSAASQNPQPHVVGEYWAIPEMRRWAWDRAERHVEAISRDDRAKRTLLSCMQVETGMANWQELMVGTDASPIKSRLDVDAGQVDVGCGRFSVQHLASRLRAALVFDMLQDFSGTSVHVSNPAMIRIADIAALVSTAIDRAVIVEDSHWDRRVRITSSHAPSILYEVARAISPYAYWTEGGGGLVLVVPD